MVMKVLHDIDLYFINVIVKICKNYIPKSEPTRQGQWSYIFASE